MSRFQYRARTGRGDLLEGHLEAADANAVAAQLLNGGITPIDIHEAPASESALELIGSLVRLSQIVAEPVVLLIPTAG